MQQAELGAEPASGRVFESILRPGIADAVEGGRVRLDAIARWLQDVAYADLVDAGIEQRGVWIVRRTRIRVERFPRFGDEVALRTFCSALGRFSAERRTGIRGAAALVEAVSLWIWIDEHGVPARFPQRFRELYAPSASGRSAAPTRLRHPDPESASERTPWVFRAADVDVVGHVNNSHYWAILEEDLAPGEPAPIDAEIEHREPAHPGPASILRAGERRWVVSGEDVVHASLRLG